MEGDVAAVLVALDARSHLDVGPKSFEEKRRNQWKDTISKH